MTLETNVIVRCDGVRSNERKCRNYVDDDCWSEPEALEMAAAYGYVSAGKTSVPIAR